MNLVLDIRTLMFASATIDAMLSVVMLLAWHTRKTYPGFGSWTIGHFCLLPAFLLFGLRGYIPDLLSVVAANLFQSASLVALAEGIRRFYTQPRDPVSPGLSALLAPGLLYFLYVRN